MSRNYKLDPAWYYTSPGLSWDALLKQSKIKLQLLHDYDMLMFIERGIRGGVSMISKRYSEANKNKPTKYIQYLDANNLWLGNNTKTTNSWIQMVKTKRIRKCRENIRTTRY